MFLPLSHLAHQRPFQIILDYCLDRTERVDLFLLRVPVILFNALASLAMTLTPSILLTSRASLTIVWIFNYSLAMTLTRITHLPGLIVWIFNY